MGNLPGVKRMYQHNRVIFYKLFTVRREKKLISGLNTEEIVEKDNLHRYLQVS